MTAITSRLRMDSPALPPTNAVVVVLGGSVAGMSAAALLAKHARVVIVDGDREPDDDSVVALPRAGTPQAQHLRGLCQELLNTNPPFRIDVLLESGINAWELLLPGFKQLLVENGGIPFTMGTEIQWFMFHGYLVCFFFLTNN